MKSFLFLFLLLLLAVALPAFAEMPEEFKPIRLTTIVKGEKVYDLSPILAEAKKKGKPVFFYISSSDCPYCRGYENYIRREKERMTEVFSSFLVVSVELPIMKDRPEFLVGGKRYTLKEFKDSIGDGNKGFYYPYFLSLVPSGDGVRQTHQLPNGASHYTNVENHARLLQIPKDVLAAAP